MGERGQGAPAAPLSATDYHILMVLAEKDLYGYAIMKAVGENSNGTVAPEIGSLYRVLSRLVAEGWVEEAAAPRGAALAPGDAHETDEPRALSHALFP